MEEEWERGGIPLGRDERGNDYDDYEGNPIMRIIQRKTLKEGGFCPEKEKNVVREKNEWVAGQHLIEEVP